MKTYTFTHQLFAAREDKNGSGLEMTGGETPQRGEPVENAEDMRKILADRDESGDYAATQASSSEEGMAGPAMSSIEVKDLSDEFLAGKVDLVQQMNKTVDAISDALESEMRDGPAPEMLAADDDVDRSTNIEEISEAGEPVSEDDLQFMTSVRTMDEAGELGITFDNNVVGDYLYQAREDSQRSPNSRQDRQEGTANL